ncbi:hypothetical protein ABT337_19430 [Saccharopolyspora hirsuta]|uniref:Uncharacterized protein n=1 Tax=Saccharopolyspora hirsuta TaxID=1837 RepID=A0A5M7BUD7_SACHI|nr:hypothetical protein [Saccharopolyspora hirsuta]KAA5833409.1 hypothetical protein F1721_14035 [Saccharopolyspora hirsuta]MBF6507917.1 hypothetical protein [Nocardia farcinica]
MDHDELVRKYSVDPSTLSPEMRAKVEAARESIRRRKRASDPAAEVNPADNFPIGLDDNFNPFPASRNSAANRGASDPTDGDAHDK